MAQSYLALRRFRLAEQTYDRIIGLKPDDPSLKIYKAYLFTFGEIRSEFTAARDQLNRKVEESPDEPDLLSALGIVDAALGRKEEAIQEAKSATEMLPVSKAAEMGPGLVANLAIAYEWSNELELAFQELTISVNTPNSLLYGELKLNPVWDQLRKDSRFEKLLSELAPRD